MCGRLRVDFTAPYRVDGVDHVRQEHYGRSDCRAAGADAIAVQGDVSKNDDCERLIKACIDKWGRLDVLINNAATTRPIPHKRMDLLDAAEFQRIFSVNVIGTYQMTRAAAPHLKATGFFTEREHPTEGPIVTFASPLDFEKTKVEFRRHAPRIGEDGAEILREAGLGDEAIEKLKAEKALIVPS